MTSQNYQIPGIDSKGIMIAFAQYGFRKTSMEDIARASDLSRQSIYKKFGSKEACYDQILLAYMSGIYGEVFAMLAAPTDTPVAVLEAVFERIGEDAVAFANTPHGPEVMEDALRHATKAPERWPAVFEENLAQFFHQHGFAASRAHADDIAFVMVTASRGSLIHAETVASYCADMHRVYRTITQGNPAGH
ncbi:TetR/AcrR family transcriptional regulator [Phaeobacter sp. CNT1-3]|nr:TetR/AcrR family transcriptional regulator [Phaeobacter sp. CNT1-3]